jgi:3-oxoacyl-[acyl-carrier protein] reductase
VDDIVAKHGRVDILVNNAGITRDGLFLRMKEEDWDAVINVNLKGTFNACKSVSRVMLKARKGKIINIGSVIGVMGNAGQANYAASKAGVIALAKSLAREFASRNITVNAVAPGYIKTAMTDKLSDEVKNKILEAVPLNRMGSPTDVANVCLFLASKEADYVTGQTILVDGGMVTY